MFMHYIFAGVCVCVAVASGLFINDCHIPNNLYISNAASVTHHFVKNETLNSTHHRFAGQVQLLYKTWPMCAYTCKMTVISEVEHYAHVVQILTSRFPIYQTASIEGNAQGCIYRGFACNENVDAVWDVKQEL